jgi:hypothetical protein
VKYIAVIGCSFTDHAQQPDPEKWNSWCQYIPQDFPNVEVHNYGFCAMASNYFEMLLRGLAHFKHYKYDAVIIQLSSNIRWALPLDTPTENYTRYNDFWKAKNPEFVVEEDPFKDILIVEHEIPTNIPRYKHMIDLSSLITFGGVVKVKGKAKANITGIRHNEIVDKSQLQYINNLVQGGLPTTIQFFNGFVKTLPMYEKYFSKVFYWQPRGSYNNIGKDIGGFELLEENTTNFLKYTNAIDNDPAHLNALGNQLLYRLYIKNSAIGDWLNDQ